MLRELPLTVWLHSPSKQIPQEDWLYDLPSFENPSFRSWFFLPRPKLTRTLSTPNHQPSATDVVAPHRRRASYQPDAPSSRPVNPESAFFGTLKRSLTLTSRSVGARARRRSSSPEAVSDHVLGVRRFATRHGIGEEGEGDNFEGQSSTGLELLWDRKCGGRRMGFEGPPRAPIQLLDASPEISPPSPTFAQRFSLRRSGKNSPERNTYKPFVPPRYSFENSSMAELEEVIRGTLTGGGGIQWQWRDPGRLEVSLSSFWMNRIWVIGR